ncbi:MAG: Wzz/FepE/Etk N-terminal domain-containing protein [Desulfobacterota bacterium]|nr:Wzz/FepE/Etk N-terminal domain-containing protein [Thermodesulfobacteriota bacterium]
MEEHRMHQWEDDDEIDLIDLATVLAKRKKLIVGMAVGAALVTAVISLIMTPVYRAETKILSPQTSSSMAAQIMSQLGAASVLLGGAPAMKSQNELYIELVKSRPVLDRVLDRFDLMKRYDTDSREEARKALLENIRARDSIKSGIITVGLEDPDPKLAADMANALIEELRALNKGLSISEAAQRRLFFEEQLKDAKESLSRAEDAMKGFQEKSGAVQIDAQASAAIEGISSLRAAIAAKEVQVRVMRTYSTPQNPDILRAVEELRGMREQLEKLEAKNEDGSVMVPTGNLPSASTEYARRMRDLKFSETLYELLFSQFQAAKLDEARDATLIQVVEKAVPPEKRIRPKRTLMAVLALIAGLFVSILAAFFMEYRENAAKDPGRREKVAALKRYLSLR